MVSRLINETNFAKLYDVSKNLFSIGYDIQENRLVDSYYDLLASEARLASFVAIAKRDISYKHWFSLSRTLTNMDRYKGLVSWSGTMFEYFMPLVVMPTYPYTLLDETYEFCIYSQMKYARKLNIPFGISESAFNLQDLHNNYQYKAFGIPWLGLKRGLKEEIVVSPYSSIMVLPKAPKIVMKNIAELKKLGAYEQYGFYDAIDFTPNRVSKKGYSVVKTYMAHHQALILLSINNYHNHGILQERMFQNEEMQSAMLLLQERVPSNIVFTKKKKEKVKVLKYKNYEEYVENHITKPSGNMNIQSNNAYTLLVNDFGESYATFDNLLLTKHNDIDKQGVCFYCKDLDMGKFFSSTIAPMKDETAEYEVKFSPSMSRFYYKSDRTEMVTQIAVSPEENLEMRKLTIRNPMEQELHVEIISYVEPVLAFPHNDIVHPAYNNLFFRVHQEETAIILEKRLHHDVLYYLNFMVAEEERQQELELDKMKVIGRLRTVQNPLIGMQDIPYSNMASISTNTICSLKKELKIGAGETKELYFYYGVSRNRNDIWEMYQKYKGIEAGKRLLELAYAKSLVENRFLGYKGKDILLYDQLYAVLQNNQTREKYREKIIKNSLTQSHLWKFGISGDYPILLTRIYRVNDIYVIKDLLSAMEYFHRKNVYVDFVVLNEEENKYEQYVQDKIYETISSLGVGYLLHQNGGVFIVKKNDITEEEENLLYSCSDLILNARDGFLKEQLEERDKSQES